jgi:TonB family protein
MLATPAPEPLAAPEPLPEPKPMPSRGPKLTRKQRRALALEASRPKAAPSLAPEASVTAVPLAQPNAGQSPEVLPLAASVAPVPTTISPGPFTAPTAYDAVPDAPVAGRSISPVMLAGIAALVLLLAAGIFGWKKTRNNAVPPPALSAPDAAVAQPVSSTAAGSSSAIPSARPATQAGQTAAPPNTARTPLSPRVQPDSQSALTDDTAERRTPQLISPTPISTGKPAEASAVEPPPTLAAPAPATGAIAKIIRTPTVVEPRLATPVSKGLTGGQLIHRVTPEYPKFAAGMNLQGQIVLKATITKAGTVGKVQLISGDRRLALAAMDAVKKWRYTPHELNGEPIELEKEIVINFNRR